MYSDKILKQFSLLGKLNYLFFIISVFFAIDMYFALLTSYEIFVTLELLILITGITSILEVIFLLVILIQLKKMDSVLKERNFHAFFSYTFSVFILFTISTILSLLVYTLSLLGNILSLGSITLLIIGFIIGTRYIAAFFLLFNRAWKSLEKFFYSKSESFPNKVADNAIRAIENFHFGATLYVFVIPGIIGAFYYLKGCILLGEALKSDAQLEKRLESNKEITQNTFEYSIEARKTDSLELKK